MKKLREVVIEKWKQFFLVRIVNRTKGQRHIAAQFYYFKPDGSKRTLDDVKKWVESQPHLKLVEMD